MAKPKLKYKTSEETLAIESEDAVKLDAEAWVQESTTDVVPPDVKLLRRENQALKRKLTEGLGSESLIRSCCESLYVRAPELTMPPRPKSIGKGTVQVAIAHISDTQLGKNTITYDPVVCGQRLRAYAQRVVEITEVKRSGSKIEDLRLYLGGDMVEGEIGNYPSQPYDVTSSVIRQAMREAPDIFEAMIYYLLRYFKNIHIVGVPGNHGRGASRHATRHTETNWDRVFYWILHDRILGSETRAEEICSCKSNNSGRKKRKKYKDCCGKEMRKRVTFDIPEGDQFWVMDRVWGWGNLIVHGDQIRGWSGIPYYGVSKKVAGWADCMPKDWDNLLFGHFHTFASGTINHRRWFANGTTESSNTYALEQLASAGEPCQRLLFMTEKNGVVSDHQIFLEDNRLPIMQRKLQQAVSEFGVESVQSMLGALGGSQG